MTSTLISGHVACLGHGVPAHMPAVHLSL